MARKRMIDPHIWEDPSFNKLSREARLLLIGMISNADDEGYIRGDAGSLKRLIFGFDDALLSTVGGWVTDLHGFKNLHFYEVNGEEYAHFTKWSEYQKQKQDRVQDSIYPECTICHPGDGQVPDIRQTDDGQVPAEVKLSKVKLSKVNIKETATAVSGTTNELISLFKEINPNFELLYSNKTQRHALDRMVKKHGFEKIKRSILYATEVSGKKYAPQITTPYQLEEKMGSLIAFAKSRQADKPIIAVMPKEL